MKKTLIIAAICLAVACSHSKHTASSVGSPTGDGSSYSNAVVIKETSESRGVTAEYKWLSEKYPNYKMQSQSLVYENKKPYDVLTITTADGETKEVYFDISNFFGKF